MEKGETNVRALFKVPVSELEMTLCRLGEEGFLWKGITEQAEMGKYYNDAISRDYGTMIPVLDIELTTGSDTGKLYKFVSLTTDRLLEINKDSRPVKEFEDLAPALSWD